MLCFKFPLLLTRFSNQEWDVLIRTYFGVRIVDDDTPNAPQQRPCSHCRSLQDNYGIHMEICAGPEGRSKKHNAVRDALLHLCADAGIAAHCETQHLLGNDGRKPADVLVPSGIHGSPQAWDVTIVHSYNCSDSLNNFHVSKLIDRKEKSKDKEYTTDCQVVGIDYVPLVFASHGGFSAKTVGVIKFIADAYATKHCMSKSEAAILIRRRLAVTLARYRAHSLLVRRANVLNNDDKNYIPIGNTAISVRN